MLTTRVLGSAVLAVALPLSAHAVDLKPMQAHTVELGEQTAVVYYTETGDDIEVVITLAANDGSGVPVRYTSTLAIDACATLSLADARRSAITIARSAGVVSVQAEEAHD